MVATRNEPDDLLLGDPDDLALLTRARAGDTCSADELWVRTWPSALAVARYVADSPVDAEDLASEAMAVVFTAIARGQGPTTAVRAYVGTTIRNLHLSALRRQSRVGRPVELDDDRVLALVADGPDVIESELVGRAFRGLPTRWRLVLWATLVEGRSGADVAAELGTGADAVHALKARALEGLRRQYLTEHARRGDEQECRTAHRNLAASVRGRKRREADSQQLWRHLRQCSHCAEAYRELTEINSRLGALVGPGVLGVAVLGTGTGGAGLGLLHGLRWEGLRAASVGAAAWGTAAVVVGVVGVSAVELVQRQGHDAATLPPTSSSAPSSTSRSGDAGASTSPRPSIEPVGRAAAPGGTASSAPGAACAGPTALRSLLAGTVAGPTALLCSATAPVTDTVGASLVSQVTSPLTRAGLLLPSVLQPVGNTLRAAAPEAPAPAGSPRVPRVPEVEVPALPTVVTGTDELPLRLPLH